MRGTVSRAVYAAGLAALLGVAALGIGVGWAPERELLWARGTGWAAVTALLLALSATPAAALVRRLLGTRLPVAPFRRAAGITAAALGSVHASVALSTYLQGAWAHLLDIAWIRAGVLALAVLLALLVTSFPRVTRALRISHWKALHRLAYVAGALAFQHAVLAPFAPRRWVLGVFAGALAVGLLRLVPRRAQAPATADRSRSHSET